MKRVVAIVLLTFVSVEARADRWVNMDMEDWVTDCEYDDGGGIIYRPSNPGPDSAYLEFQGNYQCPWITASTKYAGAKALGMWLKPSITTRSEIVVANPLDPYALQHGQTKWLGFAMQINNTSSNWPLPTHVVFHQTWMVEANKANPSCGIPLVGELITGTGPGASTPLSFRFYSKRDGGGDTIVSPREMTIGPWHTFVLGLLPNPTSMPGPGNIVIVYDGALIAAFSGDWGCTPVPGQTEELHVRVGQYRPSGGENLVMIFDNIRFASTGVEATP